MIIDKTNTLYEEAFRMVTKRNFVSNEQRFYRITSNGSIGAQNNQCESQFGTVLSEKDMKDIFVMCDVCELMLT